MQLLIYAKPNQTNDAMFRQWFVPLGWGATHPSGPLAYTATNRKEKQQATLQLSLPLRCLHTIP